MTNSSYRDGSAALTDQLPAALGGFDLTDKSKFAVGFPHEVFARLRREAPVLRHPPGHSVDGESFWVISRYLDIKEAAANPAFSSQGGGGRAGGGTHVDDLQPGIHAGVLLNMLDDPRHQLVRDLVSPSVARQVVASQVPQLRSRVAQLLDDAVARGTCDFQPDVSAPFAIQTVALSLGAPEEDWPQLVEWAQAVAGLDSRESGEIDNDAAVTGYAVYQYSQKLIALKRAAGQTTDMMSAMARQDIPEGHGEEPLSEYEREAYFCLLLMAGSEPPRNTMAGGVLALAQHPDQWKALRADRSLLPGAVEEMLRWSSPTPYNRRTATCDVTFRDAEIKAGEKITFWWVSANRDETVFDNPNTFDIRRDPNPHMAFGHGIHSCMGEHLARIEIRLLLEEMLDRVAEIRLAGPVQWAASNKHTVTLHLPLELVRG
jgi:cytochrome P450